MQLQNNPKPIEILAPAKNAQVGIAAINHGADAVYIGAPLFSARSAAGNSISEIAELTQYAHRFGAKVLVALNTILDDSELQEAEKMIWELYHAGTDALIVQDMGVLTLNLPPIALHASTQCDNRTPEKVLFLQQAGFKRAVLARELNLHQIAAIRAATHIELEAFVHGALCVSYSGQCYISQALCGRSANRGTCAQMCRLPYNLLDADKNVIVANKHLLSLKDLDRSEHLAEMMQAGISTFKIEGRLKEASYVKNIVSYYRQKLDSILEQDNAYTKSSFGKTYFFFEPNPQKTFNRGATDYFLHQRTTNLVQLETPKSLGEYIGKVRKVNPNNIVVETKQKLANGDGLCYIDQQNGFGGFKINRVEGGTHIYPAKMPRIIVGTSIYRNFDHEFEKVLEQKTAERKLLIDMCIGETANGFELSITQVHTQQHVVVQKEIEKQLAQKAEQVENNIRTQLSKLGGTNYEAANISILFSQPWFMPASILNEMRRNAIEQLEHIPAAPKKETTLEAENSKQLNKELNFRANIYNKAAQQFYTNYGATVVELAYESAAVENVALMTCKYCIKHNMGICPKQRNDIQYKEPLYIETNQQVLELSFNCKDCEMEVKK